MKRIILRLPLMLFLFFAAYPAYCSTYYVSPTGNDTTGNGSIGNPWKTIPKAVTMAVAGDTIYVRGGTHIYTTTITISKSGSAGARFYLFAYPGERPILDFSAMSESSSNRGIRLSGSYWHIYGLDIYKAGDNGMNVSGSYNIIEFCRFYENRDTGLQLGGGAAYNQIVNCDSYYNADSSLENADGFAPKLDVGTGNYFYGCRAWQNLDDGYDGYLRPSDNILTTYENCWAFKNGYLKSGAPSGGDGNGFKMGGSDDKTLRHNVILINCLTFHNAVKGFDQNNNKGSMTLYNCTGFGSGTYNYSIATSPLASGKTATVTNCVYYTGSNNLGAFVVQTTNSWMPPFVVDSTDFVSIDPSAAYGPRNADGSLPDITFMHLAAGSDLIDGGTDVGLPYNGSAPDLGCFETEGGSPPDQASNPVPSNGATNVDITQDLSWTAGSGATSHDVYFGTATSPPFVANQAGTTFDTGTMASLTTYYWRIDERNESGVTTGTVWYFTTQDTQAPLPNPMEWAIEPNAISSSAITMTAATASDVSGVEYYFANLTDPNHDSGWQDGTAYTDTGLTNDTTYFYQVIARDKSGNQNETGWSDTASATTLIYDCTGTITSDLDGDCEVDFFDYAILTIAWEGDLADIAQFAVDWLICNREPESECWQ
ncbi:MAG: right-handed parallel beta-helix repeat-containing protein [Sedimentisphaerales bacterium]|nr:right-handed parallel beta-helix repeat-containing protein [Sedimentisphaerales bacterium]